MFELAKDDWTFCKILVWNLRVGGFWCSACCCYCCCCSSYWNRFIGFYWGWLISFAYETAKWELIIISLRLLFSTDGNGSRTSWFSCNYSVCEQETPLCWGELDLCMLMLCSSLRWLRKRMSILLKEQELARRQFKAICCYVCILELFTIKITHFTKSNT